VIDWEKQTFSLSLSLSQNSVFTSPDFGGHNQIEGKRGRHVGRNVDADHDEQRREQARQIDARQHRQTNARLSDRRRRQTDQQSIGVVHVHAIRDTGCSQIAQ
jgi:hypothetical protein